MSIYLGNPNDQVVAFVDKRINGKILAETTTACYSVCLDKGATMPSENTPLNLSSCIEIIPAGGIDNLNPLAMLNDPTNKYKILQYTINFCIYLYYDLPDPSTVYTVNLPSCTRISLCGDMHIPVSTITLPKYTRLNYGDFHFAWYNFFQYIWIETLTEVNLASMTKADVKSNLLDDSDSCLIGFNEERSVICPLEGPITFNCKDGSFSYQCELYVGWWEITFTDL